MNAHVLKQLEAENSSERECMKGLMTVFEILNPGPGQPGQSCHPVLIRRWRSGQVIWEGLPEEFRLMHRCYPRPVERSRPCSEGGQ
jgi:hypothetical protein